MVGYSRCSHHGFAARLSLNLASFLAWSVSFYPQPLLNWQRRSVVGFAIDFPFLNVLGFAAYTISTAAFYYSPTIQKQYAARHPGSPETTVRFNDFVFAAHGFLFCVITYSQFFPRLWGFKVDASQRPHKLILGIFWGGIIGTVLTLLIVLGSDDPTEASSNWAWIDVIYSVSYIKVITTVAKYCPQAVINARRKSTVGWSIGQTLLDLAGGILSLLQLCIDASLQGATLSGIIGNPVKFLLGNVSILFDIIFCVQHYM